MRKTSPTSFLGVWLAAFAGLIAARPLWRLQLPDGADAPLHLYRLVQLEQLLLVEKLFQIRWSPDLVLGYGYPLFNYYGPVSYFVALGFRLFGFEAEASLVLAMILFVVLASVGMYVWARVYVRASAALVGAVAYVFAPYLYINAVHRVAFAELCGMALIPWVFGLWARGSKSGGRLVLGAGVISFSLLIATHNITALIVAPILGFYLMAMTPDIKTLLTKYGLMLVGIGLAGWYWIPAIFEQDLVQISRSFDVGMLDYANNFLALTELMPWFPLNDARVLNPSIPHGVHLIVLAVGCLGLGAVVAGKRSVLPRVLSRMEAGFVLLVILVLGLLTLAISEPVWDSLPLIHFLQFPWRLIGVINGMLALGCAVCFAVFMQDRGRVVGSLVFALILLWVLPWSFVRYADVAQGVTMADSVAYERSRGVLGTTSTGEYLPVWVAELPQAEVLGQPKLREESVIKGGWR